jgi:hypothetical protein
MQHLFEDGRNEIHHRKLHQGPKTVWMVHLHDEFKLVKGHGGNPWIHNEEEVSSFLCKISEGCEKKLDFLLELNKPVYPKYIQILNIRRACTLSPWNVCLMANKKPE